jgi:hypothetical protein
MPRLSPAEIIELGSIPLVTGLAAWLAPRPGLALEIGEWLAGGALLLLGQGLVRDLWLLREARQAKPVPAPVHASCLCVESALGLTSVLAGIGLVGFGRGSLVRLSPDLLAGGVAVIMVAGFLLKDFVVTWSPWGIRREKDHAQVIFRWRR